MKKLIYIQELQGCIKEPHDVPSLDYNTLSEENTSLVFLVVC